MKRSHRGIALDDALAAGDVDRVRALRTPNCATLDADFGRKRCRACGRPIMYVRRSRRARAHWSHVGDGLGQYASWRQG